ncbi:MAG TPA: hypothetical protein VK762_03195 [Polyangiaceae bacterium]|nr:hypothetical protein [Polyangiaceae bacterium]
MSEDLSGQRGVRPEVSELLLHENRNRDTQPETGAALASPPESHRSRT